VPELPEVESVRRRIEPLVRGRRFEEVEIRDVRLVAPLDPREVAAELTGESVAAVDRRGKYLVFRFESGRVLLVHLRMTGSLEHGAELADDPYRRAEVALDDATTLAYRDVRRFGTWLLLEPGEDVPYLAAKLGDEPLEEAFTVARLAERLKGRRAPVKAGEDPSAQAGAQPAPGRGEAPARGDPRRARVGDRPAGLDAARLPAPRRQLGRHADRVPRLRPRRRAVRAL
jgi:DNA-formamidopyrimidine glycosylase